MGKASVKFEAIQEVLSQHENELSVSLLCEVAGVSRPGYYSWLKAEGARQAREEKDRADFALVLEAYRYPWLSERGKEHLYAPSPQRPARTDEREEDTAPYGQIRAFLPNQEGQPLPQDGESA